MKLIRISEKENGCHSFHRMKEGVVMEKLS